MLSVAKYFFSSLHLHFHLYEVKTTNELRIEKLHEILFESYCFDLFRHMTQIWHIYLLSEYDEIGWNASCPFSVVVEITQIDATRGRIIIIIFIVIWVISFHKLNSANSWVIWFLIWMRINWKFSAYVFHVMNVIQGISLLLLFERCSIHDWFDTLWIKHKWNNKLQCIPIFNCSI